MRYNFERRDMCQATRHKQLRSVRQHALRKARCCIHQTRTLARRHSISLRQFTSNRAYRNNRNRIVCCADIGQHGQACNGTLGASLARYSVGNGTGNKVETATALHHIHQATRHKGDDDKLAHREYTLACRLAERHHRKRATRQADNNGGNDAKHQHHKHIHAYDSADENKQIWYSLIPLRHACNLYALTARQTKEYVESEREQCCWKNKE